MLPTRLSPVTVDNQYIVSLAVAFPTICCPSPFYFVIAQCEKRHHSGDAADGMMFIGVVRSAGTGYPPDEGPANAQRR